MNQEQGPIRRHSLGGSVWWFALSYVMSVAGFVGLNALAARALGTDDFGRFVVVYTLALVLGQVGLLGVHRAGVREVARLVSFESAEARDLRDDLGTVSRTCLPAVAVGGGATLALALGDDEGSFLLVGTVIAALIYLTGQQKLTSNYLRGMGRVRFAGVLEGRSGGGLVVILQAALLALVMAVEANPGLTAVLAVISCGYVVPIGIGRAIISRQWVVTRRKVNHVVRLATIWRRDWRFFALSTASSTSQYVEVWLAGAVLVAADTSYFSAGHRLASLLVIPLASMQVVASPAISRLWHQQELGTLTALVRTAATLATVVTGVLLIPLMIAPDRAMSAVFGAAFADAGTVLVLLAIGMLGNVVSGLCGAVLSMSGHEGRSAVATVISLLLRLVLGFWAATSYGVIGLAVSTSVITVLLNGWLAWIAFRTGVTTLPTARPRPRLFFQVRG